MNENNPYNHCYPGYLKLSTAICGQFELVLLLLTYSFFSHVKGSRVNT